MAQVTTIEADENLSLLARTLADEGVGRSRDTWLSMYVDLNPVDYATTTARIAGVTAAVDIARRAAPDAAWSQLLDELHDRFRAADDDIDGAQGLLVYSGDPAEATIVKLPCSVEPHVTFDTSVHVRPLVAALPGDRWCALVVNRRTTRILLGDASEFEELTRYTDDVDGQHASGGIAQPRESRRIEQQAQRHIHDTLELVELLRGAGRWQHLVIAAPDELHGAVEQALPDQTRRDFVRWINCDVEHSTTSDIVTCAHACIEEFEYRGMRRMLDLLLQNAGQNGRASVGVEPTLRALNEHRVETLLLAEGFRRPGAICDHGDWLAPGSSACPVHGRTMRPVADVMEAAVEAALRSGARIVTVPRHEEGDQELGLDTREFQQLTSLGNVAAITRFELAETVVPDAWE